MLQLINRVWEPITGRSQSKDSREGTEAETMGVRGEDRTLRTGLLRLLSYTTRDHLPRDSTTHRGLGHSHISQ